MKFRNVLVILLGMTVCILSACARPAEKDEQISTEEQERTKEHQQEFEDSMEENKQ